MFRSMALMLLLLGMGTQAEPLVLSGAAYYRHLGQEYYLAALYLPEKSSSPELIFSARTIKRMRLIVNIDSWSPRMWGRDWQDNFSINNSVLSVSAATKSALLRFAEFPRADLQRGDELLIDYEVDGTTSVRLNGDLVLSESGDELFNTLLEIWIGKLPPSREFKQQILTGNHAAAMELAGSPIGWGTGAGRVHVYAGWMRQEELQRQAAEAAKAAELAKHEQVRLERIRLTQERAEKEQQEQARLAQLVKVQAASEKTELENNISVAAQMKSPAVLATEQFYYLQVLQRQVQQAVVNEIRVPDGVDVFSLQSMVRCEFYLTRQHEVVRINIPETGAPGILIKEIQRAIRAAASKPKIPGGLEGRLWPVVIEYDFSRDKYAQKMLAPPRLPESLSATD